MKKLRLDKNHAILDVDEVVADFVGGALDLFGYDRDRLEDAHEKGNWGIEKTLGVSTDEFWDRIHGEGETFWRELEPHPWADEFMRWVRDQWGHNFFFVSSPSRHPSCHAGKVYWIKEFMGDWKFDRFALTSHKEIFARPGATLIDDRETTVELFREHGGRAILFPGFTNRLHYWRKRPMQYLKGASDATLHLP